MSRDWTERFRAPRWSLPQTARLRPQRCVVGGDPTGTWEVYCWSPATDPGHAGVPIQATDRANGTIRAAITPDGEYVWWFADTDGDEFGRWRRQPWGSGAGNDEAATPTIPAAYPAGLVFADDGTVALGCSAEDGSTLWRAEPGTAPRVLYRHAQDAGVQAISRDGRYIAINHSERGDNRHPALRILSRDGESVADLDDGPGKGLRAVGFLGEGADLLVGHERCGRAELLIWSPLDAAVRELRLPIPGELSAVPAADGAWLLVTSEQRGRSTLHRVALPELSASEVSVEPGVVEGIEIRPDNHVWYAWSSAAAPPSIRDLSGAPVLPRAGPPAPSSVAVTDVVAAGPGGQVHGFLRLPPQRAGPHAAVFVVHGGPTWNDSDSWHVRAAAWVDAGYAVVMVNYRGSTGYGSTWRDAIEHSPGFVELADVAAVRATLIADGVIDEARCLLSGGSWGGFLTLLGLGTQPEMWAAGSAAVPVADYVAAYEDEMEGLKAFDRSLFGGAPAEVPDAYAKASPLTYVAAIRAPVLILAGANDPRCPIRQIENYLTALRGLGKNHQVYRFDAGHGSVVTEERIRQMAAELDFAQRHVPA